MAAEGDGRLRFYIGLMALRKTIKQTLKDEEKHKYAEFYKAFQDFASRRIDSVDLTAKMKEVFNGHPYVIMEFNSFNRRELEITEQPPRPIDIEKALNFIRKIKTRFSGADEHISRAFFDLLKTRWCENKSNRDIYKEVSVLFKGHRDLIQEFAEYAYRY